MAKPPKPDEESGHAFAETRDLFPEDMALRRAGFRIHSRPKKGGAVWERAGKTFSHAAALETLTLGKSSWTWRHTRI